MGFVSLLRVPKGEGERIWAPQTSRRGNKQTRGPELAAHNHPACTTQPDAPGCTLLVRAEPTVGALAEKARLWRAVVKKGKGEGGDKSVKAAA
jgi:hypothetical protein